LPGGSDTGCRILSIMKPLSLEEVASRAGVEDAYVRRLTELGALEGRADGYRERDVHRVALLRSWESAGLPPESILAAVRQGELSFSFLETPGWALHERPDRTYRELSEQLGVPLSLVLGLHEAIGFQAPSPGERVRQDELVMVELARAFLEVGASEVAVRRVFHLYATTFGGSRPGRRSSTRRRWRGGSSGRG
jgi:hypothetical protein